MHDCSVRSKQVTAPYWDDFVTPLKFAADVEASASIFKSSWTPPYDMTKIIEDVHRYEKVIENTKPELIIECGTSSGASAEWFASKGVNVITMDIEHHVPIDRFRRCGERVTWIIQDSINDKVVDMVSSRARNLRCMVVLDSDHHACHVLAEMVLYHELVTPGCYLVVEDGIFRWLENDGSVWALENFPYLRTHGPIDAIELFLAKHDNFERDSEIETMFPATMDPAGWLKRIK